MKTAVEVIVIIAITIIICDNINNMEIYVYYEII